MSISTIVLCILCLAFSGYSIRQALRDKKAGCIGNQAQNVISVGVIGTFIGISFALLYFDTSDIAGSIDGFLSGMKTAFWTSLIGMVAALAIKFIQATVERSDEDAYKESLMNIQEISRSVKNNTTVVNNALVELKNSVEAGSNEVLAQQLDRLAQSFNSFIASSNASQESMNNIGRLMAGQAEKLDNVADTMRESMAAFGKSQEKQIEAINSVMKENMGILGGKIQALNDGLSQQLKASGDKQIELLNSMNASIVAMRAHSEQSAADTTEMLKATRAYQAESLDNEAKQNAILDANTQSIVGMKDAFDGFVNNVKEVFGEAVIGALNRSMQNLNDQLEKQFGENFKELNDSVKALNVWQAEYKNVVDESIKELTLIQETFKHFEEVVARNVSEHIDSLNTNLKIFTETSNANVAVQENLSQTVGSLAEMVIVSKDSVEATRNVFKSFEGFTHDVIDKTNASLAAHNETVIENINAMADAMREAERQNNEAIVAAGERNAEALTGVADEFVSAAREVKDASLTMATDTSHYVKQFGESSQAVVKEIGETLEKFKVDFANNAAEAINNLEGMFEVLAKNTDKQQDKAVKTLAAQLAKVSGQMIDNYSALMSRLAELDRIIGQNGGRR